MSDNSPDAPPSREPQQCECKSGDALAWLENMLSMQWSMAESGKHDRRTLRFAIALLIAAKDGESDAERARRAVKYTEDL